MCRKSGVSTSMVVAGAACADRRDGARRNAPRRRRRDRRGRPRSPRCDARPSFATASPTCSGSCGSSGSGPAGGDVAEGAGAGADRAQDHHRGVLLLPAFADIGAGRLLAHGVELEPAHELARLVIGRRLRRLDAQPGGLAPAKDGRAYAPFRGGGARSSAIGLNVERPAYRRQAPPRASSRTASDAGRWSRSAPARCVSSVRAMA